MQTTEPSQPNMRLAVPFFQVADMDVSLHFYTEKLGFRITNKWTPAGRIEWCWLQRDAVAIMLQEPRNKESLINGTPGKGVSICIQCADALVLYKEFVSKGVAIEEPEVGNYMWVVTCKDPDGYRLDFESPTDVPEDTKYSQWVL